MCEEKVKKFICHLRWVHGPLVVAKAALSPAPQAASGRREERLHVERLWLVTTHLATVKLRKACKRWPGLHPVRLV